ncbi:hypothetical protein PIB30_073602 [Stylosanthes scabra]|uniref:F-box domain-containing protein n=1 Tax=Stylosanthes scabra TaxID=79078 RepID=A0ABU6ZN49_9FABA|nr:hypothetical protein [Stylosanthes scabra]
MGNILSLNRSKTRWSDPSVVALQDEACKRQRLSSSSCEDNSRLIPSLPDEISIQILARVPRINYLNLKLVSHAWKAALVSPELFCVRKELGTTEEWLYVLTRVKDDKLLWYGLDPLSRRWQRLPPMPKISFEDETKKGLAALPLRVWSMMGSSIKIADIIMSWLGRRDALDRMPFCGCSIGVVDGCIYALGGFSRASAMKSVWQYNPIKNSWTEASPMSVGRAYCKTGILNNKLYVVGGVTRGRGGLSPLQSAEVYDPHTGTWSQLPNMPFAKAQVLPTAFLADLLKPIATGMTSYMGSAKIKVYDYEGDSWKVAAGDVPIHDFTDAESPYLLAGLLGKIHVITKDANHNITVFQAELQSDLASGRPNLSSMDYSSSEHAADSSAESRIWRVLASRSGRSAELVSCQSLKI